MGYTLGVDLGTTYSAAAVARDGRADRFPLGNRTSTIPSVVCLRQDGEVLVGEAAERRGLLEPTRTAREFKRRLGDPTALLLGGTPYGAEALMAHLLRWIVDQVVEREGTGPDAVVLSHPANWGPYKLDLLEQTVRLAEVADVSFITEPEAAAVHYVGQERLEPGEVVAVYDFGGGTFDAAVLRYRGGDAFELVGTPEGMERIGGIDFDQAVFAHVNGALGGALAELDPDDTTAMAAVSRLRDECQLAKEQLSHDTDVDIPVLLPGLQTEVRLTRSEFESMIRPRVGETIRALDRAVRSAQLSLDDVAKVLLVGGTSRIPLVGQLVREETGRPIALDAHPKFAIAIGAALVGAGGDARAEPATPIADDTVAPVAPLMTEDLTEDVTEDVTEDLTADLTEEAEDAAGTAGDTAPQEQPTERIPPLPPIAGTGATDSSAGTDDTDATDSTPDTDATARTARVDRADPSGGEERPWQRWALIGGGLVVLLLVVFALTQLGGEDPGDDDLPVADETATETEAPTEDPTGDDDGTTAPAAEPDTVVDGITVADDGTVEVAFTTTGFQVGDSGYGVEVGWVDEFSQPIDGTPYQRVDRPSPFTGFDVLGRPVAAAGVCVQTITPDGELPVEDPEHCRSLDPSIRNALPGERLVALDEVSIDDDTYVVTYTPYGYDPAMAGEGTWHVHFYWYPTHDEDVVGANIPDAERGSWVAWDAEVFDAFAVADRPGDATHVCGVVAEHDHTILLQEDGTGYPSGSCLVLP